MTESIVRSGEDSWAVFIDGLPVGELMASLDDSGWPTSYGFFLHSVGIHSVWELNSGYSSLAEAEIGLVQAYKALIKS